LHVHQYYKLKENKKKRKTIFKIKEKKKRKKRSNDLAGLPSHNRALQEASYHTYEPEQFKYYHFMC